MSSSWLSSCPAHQVPGIIQGNEIKELVLRPESFWGSPSSAVTNISSGCSGVGKINILSLQCRSWEQKLQAPDFVLAPVGIS